MDLDSAVELDLLSGIGIENRAIRRAIGLQFVGCCSTICLELYRNEQFVQLFSGVDLIYARSFLKYAVESAITVH